MEVSLALLADAANTTGNGKLNVLGVFSQLLPPELPYVHPSMTLIIKFSADVVERGRQKDVDIQLVDADGVPMLSLANQLTVPAEGAPGRPVEMQTIIGLNGIRFERSGDYAFVVLVNGELKARVPLTVQPRPSEQEHTDDQQDA